MKNLSKDQKSKILLISYLISIQKDQFLKRILFEIYKRI